MKPLHIVTPLLDSRPLSEILGAQVKLKMEALQPAASFKIRGVGLACQDSYNSGARKLVCASGGNAGYAVAYAGGQLGMKVEVIVPETTPAKLRLLIESEGAQVTTYGKDWDAAHVYATELAHSADTAYIHPFDDPRLWRGHATLVQELVYQTEKPDAVVVAVGGGGLMLGVLQGLWDVGWQDVRVIAVETQGTASFARSVEAGQLVTLEKIDSIATTLGARTVAAETLNWTSKHPIIPLVVSDRQALDACLRFVNDHRVLVEPACGAALAAGYTNAASLQGVKSVVFIVCGGAGVDLQLLKTWNQKVSQSA